MDTNETHTQEITKKEQTTSPTVALEVTQKKTLGEKISAIIDSVGIETRQSKVMLFGVLMVVFSSGLCSFLLLPPSGFPQNKIFQVKKGDSLGKVSLLLSNGNFIRSRPLFEFCVAVVGGDKGVRAGSYVFETPFGACKIALRLAKGFPGAAQPKITIPEGLSDREVAAILSEKISQFDAAHFTEHARSLEGYLFPDTYIFLDGVTPEEVEATMKANFDKKIKTLKPQIDSSGHSLQDIVIMASILEREATTVFDRELVSGILWNRMKNGMTLDVDAPFVYLYKRKPTHADLQVKSAYNTYRNKGLPGGPIGNPGMSAILAAIKPKESPYVYYLSDNKGVMHYAKTYSEHLANIEKYLK